MYKYEIEINKRMAEYDWDKKIDFFREEDGTIPRIFIDCVYRDFRAPLSANARYGLETHYYYNEHGIFKNEKSYYYPRFQLPIKEIECAKVNNLPTDEGLYFIGMIGTNPNGESHYLIKIGTAENIKKRIQSYATYNPMLYIGGYYRVNKDRERCEDRCHCFLSSIAYAQAQNSNEWFYVCEQDYYALCELFSNEEAFEIIAKGEVDLY